MIRHVDLIPASSLVGSVNGYHALWDELHSNVRTKEQFETWIAKIEKIGCECAKWLSDYLAKNPPTHDDLARYGWDLHNAVNKKLSKPEFSWSKFLENHPA